MDRIIRAARPTDMTEIMKVMDAAKQIMRQSEMIKMCRLPLVVPDITATFAPTTMMLIFATAQSRASR